MALSQCLDDSPARWGPKKPAGNELNLQELYNERHRLALEELVSGGIDNFLDFLQKEKIPNFLSDEEMQRIVRSAVKPRFSATVHGGDDPMEQSVSASMDCSSVTYFPELSDAEPPLLEIGWPAFTTGSYRGVTRAVAHFQPSYGECIYSCKEAARRMIKSAKEVIAIVTDSLTDLDIFKDLKEACTLRKVPVYILLDQSYAPSFLKMCSNLGVRLDDLQQMRVRTITGATYFTRSGARIMGKVHERFMLIDGNRVATGSYRYNWTDGKLNSSNLIELSGQISENFDEEFRILYAQSLPIGPRFPSSARNSGIYDHLLIKHSVLASPHNIKERTAEPVCLTSTPNHKSRAQVPESQPPCEPLNGKYDHLLIKHSVLASPHNIKERTAEPVCLTSTPNHKSHAQVPELLPPCEPLKGKTGCISSPTSNSSTIGEESVEQQQQEEILAVSAPQCLDTHTSAVMELVNPTAVSCHVSTQTDNSIADSDTQSNKHTGQQQPNPITSTTISGNPVSTTQGCVTSPSSDSSSTSPRWPTTRHGPDSRPPIHQGSVAADGDLRESFHKLSKERQQRYCTIRAKLEHMKSMLSHRPELADVTNLTTGPSVHMQHKTQTECVQGQNPALLVDNVGVGTLPRIRRVQ